jgi:hypothetical protein
LDISKQGSVLWVNHSLNYNGDKYKKE